MPAAGRTRWGWHQLDERTARRLVARAGVGPGDLVLDIGAGSGAITAPLVAAGAQVVAVELHEGSRLVRADLVVPRHVALRWSRRSAPGAGRWRGVFTARITGAVAESSFRPPAPGPIAVLVLERRKS